MAGERIAQALARIEAATRRIESAADRPRGAESGEADRRYTELHRQARAALAELDQLIGSFEQ